MRSILALKRGQAVFTRRLHCSRTTSPPKAYHRQTHWLDTHHDNGWQSLQSPPQRCCISTSSTIQSSPDMFHGISLPEEKEAVQEAEVVESEEDKQRTLEMIKEVTRAELLAHSIVSNDKKDDGTGDDASNSGNETNNVGPYERRLQQLNEARCRHQEIDQQQTLEYAQSCMDIGELHYELGHMEDSQEIYMSALQMLMNCSDDEDRGGNTVQMMVALCMHSLGAIHARCGEYGEASRWYEESLKRKHNILDNTADDNIGSDGATNLRYELGKTYNGLAALEVMTGGDVQWEKAMSLFQEAERSYLHGYEEEELNQQNERDHEEKGVLEATNDASSTTVTKAAIQQMTPRHVESLINVRSNMGELLRQREKYESAVETFRSALDMARMAMENTHDKEGAKSNIDATVTHIDGPSPDEQRSTIVELLLTIADTFQSAKQYDDAAEAYEQALSSHVYFRRWSQDNDTNQRPPDHKTILPAISTVATSVKFDLVTATTVEAAIRSNLAHALAQIGQDKLALEHYEASLAIKRHIGGAFHMEVAHTLMSMGALVGGPLRDFTKALNCFKEALYIYQRNLQECSRAQESDGNKNGNAPSSSQTFFGDEDSKEIDRHVQNAIKNINLIEAALLKDGDGASSRRRRGV